MLRDRKELEEHLSEAVERIKYKRKNFEAVNKSLSEYNDIPPGFINEVAKKDSILAEIDVTILYLLADAIFNIDGSNDIRPANYFTSGEMEEAKRYRSDNKTSDMELPISIPNVLQLDIENYITMIKMTEIVKLYHNKLIVYDFETQRSPKYKKGRDGVVPIPDTNKDSVKDIAEAMLNETYLPDTMRINVFSEDADPVIYNPKTRTLTIKKGATISILDGFHRLEAGGRAVSINPDLPQVMELAIKIYDTDTAKKFFGQINTINKVAVERLEELKQEKVSYITVKQLQLNSDLKGRIASGAKVTAAAGHLTTADILANIIQDVFEPKNNYEAREIGNYLTEFFSYLFGMYGDEINDKENIMRHPKMFIGYVIIAKWFKDHDIPLKNVRQIKDTLQLNNDNGRLVNVLINNKGTSARLQKQVKEYFEKITMDDILIGGV